VEESEVGKVLAFQVFPDRQEILHFLRDDSSSASGIAELEVALDNIPDMPLQLDEV
jgi:hypothetical protein